MNKRYTLNKPGIVVLVALLLVFIIDLIIPLGVAVGVLYVCCIALLIREDKKQILFFSIVVSSFILIVPILTHSYETTWMALVNRVISIIAVWIVAYISIKHKALDSKMELYISQLENRNKELEQFTYIASHDLQEPLRTVISFTGLIEEQYKNKLDANADKYLFFIIQASQRMSSLIKGLLDYSRIGREKKMITIDCNALIKAIQDDLSTKIEETNTAFIVKKLPKVKGYENEIRMLFQNLILNAIKFSKKGVAPCIKISSEEESGFWKLSFEDNGIGIAKEHKERIFSIFQRLHNKDEYEGTGIGLSHCLKVVELHGGKIWVESELNKGSTFYITLKK